MLFAACIQIQASTGETASDNTPHSPLQHCNHRSASDEITVAHRHKADEAACMHVRAVLCQAARCKWCLLIADLCADGLVLAR